MKAVTLQQWAEWAGGQVRGGDSGMRIDGVGIDSRAFRAGGLYVALRGETHDGHDYVNDARAAGAVAAMVESGWVGRVGGLPEDFPLVVVEGTLEGLQRAAGAYRRMMDPTVVCVTGSNGKTTSKEFIRAVLGVRYDVAATRGNFNNHIGLPLSLLSIEEGQSHAVFEIGMNHPGEIAPLAALAAPDIAVVTHIGVAHLEHMKTREAIAEEKGELIAALSVDGVAVINLEGDFAEELTARVPSGARTIYVGIERGDIEARDVRIDPREGTRFRLVHEALSAAVLLRIPGRHMVANALLAAAVGRVCGLGMEEIAEALGSVESSAGRMARREWRGVRFLDDSYNANPDSMRAALATLVADVGVDEAGRRVAVLGHMGELGESGDECHRELGEYAAGCGLSLLCTVGERAAGIGEAARGCGLEWQGFQAAPECAEYLASWLVPGDQVLFKGSRSARIEQVMEGIIERL